MSYWLLPAPALPWPPVAGKGLAIGWVGLLRLTVGLGGTAFGSSTLIQSLRSGASSQVGFGEAAKAIPAVRLNTTIVSVLFTR